EQHAQKLVDPEKCKTFAYIRESKKIIFNNHNDYYFFDPVDKKTDLICKNAAEMIIDTRHKTFITVTADLDSRLNIFYKNNQVFSVENAFGIYTDRNYHNCFFFIEDDEIEKTDLYVIDLELLEQKKLEQINGLLQSANVVGDLLFLNINHDGYFYFYLYNLKQSALTLHHHIRSDNPVYALLAPNGKKIAYTEEDEGRTVLSVFEID
ncbi:MAG: hypothetical protein KDD94_12260, partial [Calditrichaeota bacterium]|nr:hypothetical protein [Calditrichota bacterium]